MVEKQETTPSRVWGNWGNGNACACVVGYIDNFTLCDTMTLSPQSTTTATFMAGRR